MLIVGLGNPGRKYERTRHNVGFLAVDSLARSEAFPAFREKFSGLFSKGLAFGSDVGLLMPQTYMNLSGDSAQPAAAFLRVSVGEVLVIHDELDLPFGTWRLKKGGGHAGHNGLRSLISRFGTPDFVRLRIGIGRPPPEFSGAVADYVLSPWSAEEASRLDDVLADVLKGIACLIRQGLPAAMNQFHPPPKPVRARPPARPPSASLAQGAEPSARLSVGKSVGNIDAPEAGKERK